MGSNRKGGENAKSGVETQRYYSKEKLIQVTKHRGYYNPKAVAIAISQNTGIGVGTLETKISSGHFTREEMICIAAYFEMTPIEFCDVFFNGVFDEDDLGHFIAHIDSVYALLHPPKKMTVREKKQKDIDDMLETIEDL